MRSLLVFSAGVATGALLMYKAASWYIRGVEQRFATSRLDAGFRAYASGVAMGMDVRRKPLHPWGHRVEHWALDEQSVIAELTSPDTYEGEE